MARTLLRPDLRGRRSAGGYSTQRELLIVRSFSISGILCPHLVGMGRTHLIFHAFRHRRPGPAPVDSDSDVRRGRNGRERQRRLRQSLLGGIRSRLCGDAAGLGISVLARPSSVESRRLATHYAIGFGAAALVWIVSAIVDPPTRYWLWALALTIDLGTPFLALHHAEKIPPDSAHLPERFGLFTIILLGESIVAVMHGMESQESWSLSAALSAFQGMSIAFWFWWWYFDGAAGASERPIHTRRQAMLFHVWNYAHWPLYTGIALAAVGVKHVVALAPGDHLHAMEAWILCGSVALAMSSVTVIGMTSEVSQRCSRLLVQALPHGCLAMLALLAGFVGHLISPVLLITALTVVSVLQVGVSLRRKWVVQNAMGVQGDEVPAFGSERGAEPRAVPAQRYREPKVSTCSGQQHLRREETQK